MRMHAAQPPKAMACHTHALEVRQFNPARVANNHKFDIALAINECADLAASFVRQLAKLTREFGRDDLMRRDAPLIQLFNTPQLVRLQTLCVAVKTFHSPVDGLAWKWIIAWRRCPADGSLLAWFRALSPAGEKRSTKPHETARTVTFVYVRGSFYLTSRKPFQTEY